MGTETTEVGGAQVQKQPPLESNQGSPAETSNAKTVGTTDVAKADTPYDDSAAIATSNAHVVNLKASDISSIDMNSWSAKESPAQGLDMMPESFGSKMEPVLNVGDKYRIIPQRCGVEEFTDKDSGEVKNLQASYFFGMKLGQDGAPTQEKPTYFRTTAVLLAKAIGNLIRDGLTTLPGGAPKLFEVTYKGKAAGKNYDTWGLVPVD